MVAGSLEIELLANIARLQQGMNEAKGLVASSMSSISKSVETAKGVLASLGVGISAGMLAGLVRATIDAADHLNDLSKSTGLAVEELSGLRLVARQGGIDLDSLAKGLQKVSVEIGKDPGKFKELGITAKDGVGQLKQLSDLFILLPDIAQRNALAQKIFGKSWSEMAPILSEGSQKLQETIDKGAKLAGVTKEMAAEADAFNDKLAELSGTGGMLNRMVAPLLPLLNLLADELLDIQKNSDTADTGFSVLAETMRAIIVLGGNVAFVLKGIGNDLGAMAAQLAALGRGDIAGFREIGRAATEDAEMARLAFDRWEKKILDVGKAAKLSGAEVSSEIQRLAARARAADPAAQAAAAAEAAAAKAAAARAKRFLEEGKGEGSLKAILDARNALAKASAEQFQQIELNTLEVFIQANERAFKAGAKDVESYYAEKSRLQLAEIDIKERALIAEMSAAKVLATSAVKEEDKIKAQAKVVEITTKLIALGKDRMKVDGPDEAAVRAWERIAKAVQDFDQQTSSINSRLYNQQKALSESAEEAELRAKFAWEVNGAYKEEIALIALRYEREKKVLEVLLMQSTLREDEKDKLRQQLKDDATAKTAAAELNEQRRIWNSIDQTAHDVFVNIWEGGSSVFKKLGQTLKASVLDLLYQMTIKKWLVSFSVTGTGQAISGMASGSGSSGMNWLTNFGGSAGDASYKAGSWLIENGFEDLGSSLVEGASSIGEFASMAGDAAGYLGALMAASDGKWGQAAGAAIGTYFGGPLGAMIGGELGKLVDGAFSGETRSGGVYHGTQFQTGPSGGEIGADGVRMGIVTTVASVNAAIKALGGAASLNGNNFISGLESSERGRGFAFAGGQLSNGNTFGQGLDGMGWMNRRGSMTQEQANAAFAEELKQATLEAIAASDAIGPLADYVRQLGDIGLLTGEQLDTAINRINKALTEKQTLEARLFELTATDLEKLTKTRNDERAAIDPTNLVLLEQVYAQEDLKAATEASTAATLANAAALSGAQNDLNEAYRNQRGEIEGARDKMLALSQSFKTFRDGLLTGPLSPLTPGQRYAETASRYAILKAQKDSGDIGALEKFPEVAQQFLEASRIYNASGSGYQSDFARVLADSEGLQSIAEMQYQAQKDSLAKLDAQVAGLVDIKSVLGGGFMTVAQAIASLAGAGGAGTIDPIVQLYQQLLNRTPDAEGGAYWRAQAALGVSYDQIRAAMMNSAEYKRMNGIPMMDTGTNYLPQDMLAYVHEGEAIVPKAYNPAAGGNAELSAQIASLEATVARLETALDRQTATLGGVMYDASAQNATTIVNGTKGNAKMAAFDQQNKPAYA